MSDPVKQQAIGLYDRFTHGVLERREFMARMVALTGSVAAANALIGTIAARADAAPLVAPGDRRVNPSFLRIAGYVTYITEPRPRPRVMGPSVMIIHENRGLNEHTRDVARRFALAGFRAFAPDFLSPVGGSTLLTEDQAREKIGKLDLAEAAAGGVAILEELGESSRGGKIGAVGFCWGGGMVNRLAVAAGDKLDAGIVYYGPAPDPSEAVRVQAPLMIHHAGRDARIAQTLWPWITALRDAGKRVTYYNYEDAEHAFNNDTSAERYNKAAADLAWRRTLRFFRQHLR